MTILHVTNKLYEFFLKNDLFDLEKNFQDIFNVSEQLDVDKALILTSLENLEKLEIIKKIKFYKEDKKDSDNALDYFWVLIAPLHLREQTVNVKPETAILISQCLNAFSESTGNKELECDSMNITNNDILNILNIIGIIGQNSVINDQKEIN